MLRISHIAGTACEAVLKVEGSITGADIDLLETEIKCAFSKSPRLVLDLRGLRHIDWAALPRLRAWSVKNVVFENASPFIRALLEGCNWVDP